eukprot:5719643-Pyramimonas_sp.AAC.1
MHRIAVITCHIILYNAATHTRRNYIISRRRRQWSAISKHCCIRHTTIAYNALDYRRTSSRRIA